LCFERRHPKQNSVIRLKSSNSPKKFFSPSQIFGLATPLRATIVSRKMLKVKTFKYRKIAHQTVDKIA